jgi:hypothetical protein
MKKAFTLSLLFYICLTISGQVLDSSKIDNQLTYSLINYYKNVYSKYSKFGLTINKNFVDLTFYGTIKYYSGWLITVRIPAKAEQMIFGDLSNDKLNDAVLNVIKEGGETGGNATEFDLAIFLNENGHFNLDNVFQSRKICQCKLGYFIPSEIKESQIIGLTYCFSENDPHCCPSVKYNTNFVYKDRKLIPKVQTNK